MTQHTRNQPGTESPAALRVGGIVLCGGKSSRMGAAKLSLPFGHETMLQRVVRLLAEAVQPVVVVAAAEQVLPPLPPRVLIARDPRPGRGPLEGLAAGLECLAAEGNCAAAYVTTCDAPLLVPAFVRQLISLLGEFDAAVPVEAEFWQPLDAVYRLSVLPVAQRLLTEDRLRPYFLLAEINALQIPVEELRHSDPELLTLRNLNHPHEYAEALRLAGF